VQAVAFTHPLRLGQPAGSQKKREHEREENQDERRHLFSRRQITSGDGKNTDDDSGQAQPRLQVGDHEHGHGHQTKLQR
jgi:hypothetical protein